MSPFEELHPALRYHVVNTLGWTELRPTQIAAIKPVQSGDTVLLVAPTAGGKTEAAVLPLLSRMATEGWQGLSALYVCPLRALLNHLTAEKEIEIYPYHKHEIPYERNESRYRLLMEVLKP